MPVINLSQIKKVKHNNKDIKRIYSFDTVVWEQDIIGSLEDWVVDEAGTTILGYKGSTVSNLTIPNIINGKRIICVGLETNTVNMFSNYNSEMTNSLISLTIPHGIKTIGNYAFYYCQSLETIKFPQTIEKIGNFAFAFDKKIKKIDINSKSNNLTIGEYAIEYCDNFTDLKLRCKGIIDLKYSCFYCNSNLQNIFIDCEEVYNGVEGNDWYGQAFYGCNNKKSIIINANIVKFITPTFYSYSDYNNETKEYIFPPECTVTISNKEYKPTNKIILGYQCFYGNNVKELNIIGSNIEMGYNCFYNSYNGIANEPMGLENVNIINMSPNLNDIVKLGPYAFYYNKQLKTFNIKGAKASVDSGTFYENDLLETFTTEIVDITNTQNSSVYSCFYKCGKLKDIKLSEGITKIVSTMFGYCNSLTNVVLPSTITKIEYGAFQFCENLISINIPESVLDIDGNTKDSIYKSDTVFDGCISLKEIKVNHNSFAESYYSDEQHNIYDKLVCIDNECENRLFTILKVTIFEDSTEEQKTLKIFNIKDNSIKKIFINNEPKTLPDNYSYYTGDERSHFILPQGENIIKIQGSFSLLNSKCNIEVIKLQDNLTNCEHMFQGCSNLVNFETVIPSTVTNCTAMFYETGITTTPNIPQNVISCSMMFYECKNLTTISEDNKILYQTKPEFNDTFNCLDCYYGCNNIENIDDLPFDWGYRTSYPEIDSKYTYIEALKDGEVGLSHLSATEQITEIYINDIVKELPTLDNYDTFNDDGYNNEDNASALGGPVIYNVVKGDIIKIKGNFAMKNGTTEIIVRNIQNDLTNINHAFTQSGVRIVYGIPSSVTECFCTFKGCSKLLFDPLLHDNIVNCNYTFEETSFVIAPAIPKNAQSCRGTFSKCSNLISPPIIPYGVTTCDSMFSYCNNLKIAPEIPDSVINCRNMFYLCKSITIAPQISKFVEDCEYMFTGVYITVPPVIPNTVRNCNYMFKDCWLLKSTPIIPISVESCIGMFYGCSGLTSMPELPDNIVNCKEMFYGCSSIKEITNIPKFAVNCNSMFKNCRSLIKTSTIPETVTNCYGMFWGCSALKIAPIIPKTISNCSMMFYDCTSLYELPDENIELINNKPDTLIASESCYYNCKIGLPNYDNKYAILRPHYYEIPSEWTGEYGYSWMIMNVESGNNVYGKSTFVIANTSSSSISKIICNRSTLSLPTGSAYNGSRYDHGKYLNVGDNIIAIKGEFSLNGTTGKIKEISLSQTLKNFKYMFYNCSGLEKFDFALPSDDIISCYYTFYNCQKLYYINPKNFDLINNHPTSLSHNKCFYGCTQLGMKSATSSERLSSDYPILDEIPVSWGGNYSGETIPNWGQ